MIESVTRLTVFALYQLTVVVGILLLPLALAANRIGIELPVGDLIDRMESTLDNTVN
ncbi:MAG: hypothetical protein ACOC0Z_04790 [Halohasta sp.]